MKIDFEKAWIVIYLFMLVFAPPIFSFNIIYILVLLALVSLIGSRTKIKFKISKTIILLMMWCFFVVFNTFLNEIFSNRSLLCNRVTIIYQIFGLIPMQVICAMYIKKFCDKRSYGYYELADLCIKAGLIEVIFVIVSFIFPRIRWFFIDMMIINGGKSVYSETLTTYRGYGFADTLLDTFGYGIGILAGLCIFRKKIEFKHIIFCALFIFSTAVNSRTGIAMFLIIVIMRFFYFLKDNKTTSYKLLKLFSILFIMLIFSVIGVNLLYITGINQTTTFQWIITGFESIYDFLTKTENSYRLGSMQNSLLSSNFWQLPDSLMGMLIGFGHSCYGTRGIIGFASDVGYINYIWFCGFIGLILLLVCIIAIFNNRLKCSKLLFEQHMLMMLLITFFVMFIKGNVISHTAGTSLLILILVRSYSTRKNCTERK